MIGLSSGVIDNVIFSRVQYLHFFLPNFPLLPFPLGRPLFCRCIIFSFLCRAFKICSLDFNSLPRAVLPFLPKLFPVEAKDESKKSARAEYLHGLILRGGPLFFEGEGGGGRLENCKINSLQGCKH